MNETTAREAIEKLATKYAATGGTANQAEFAEWLLETSGYAVRTERERKAFLAAAVMTVSSYKVFQAAKPTSANYTAPKRTRKPRARKAAA